MKRNFYLQHPLTTMHAPRMEQLAEKEGLKGLGTYWVIIEKLKLLPEPRARKEYLLPYCNGKKITLTYLMKIIQEYGLSNWRETDISLPKS